MGEFLARWRRTIAAYARLNVQVQRIKIGKTWQQLPGLGSDSATDSIDARNSSERGEMPELRVEEQIRVGCF